MDFSTILIVCAFLFLIVGLVVGIGFAVSQEQGDTSAQIKLFGIITGNSRAVLIIITLGILSVVGLKVLGVVIEAKKSESSRQQLKAPVNETGEKGSIR